MNAYIAITRTGVVIVNANSAVEAVEQLSDHNVISIHINQTNRIDVWIKGKDAATFTKIRNID